MATRKFFLIVRADGSHRTVTKLQRGLRWDEVAYRVNLTVPDAWGEVNGDIDITMPEPPKAELRAVEGS